MPSLYKKIKNANPEELRRWRFVFWTSFLTCSLLLVSLILLLDFHTKKLSLYTPLARPNRTVTSLALAPLYAVMIDNALEARPQSGLNQAKLIFEASVEGGYTRFMAIFDSAEPVDEIGPVRSVRPYFIDWAASLGATIGHVGGSPEAMEELKTYSFENIDGISTGCCFWRSKERFAPHNTYTSLDLLKRKQPETPLPDIAFRQSEKIPDGGVANLGAKLPFTSGFIAPEFHWNPILKTYLRYQGTDVFKDKDAKPVMAENVVILKTDIEVIDEKSRRSIRTTGDGDADFLIGGKHLSGTWHRDQGGFPVFKDRDGKKIEFNPGKIWIAVINGDAPITYF